MHYFYEQIKDGMVCLRLWRSSVVTWHFERPLTNVHARKSDVPRCPRHKFEDDLDTYDFTTQIVYSCKGFKFIFMILFPFFMILCFNKSCINMMPSSTFTFSPAHNHKCFTDQIISTVMAPTFCSVRKQKLVVKLSTIWQVSLW